MPNEKPKENDKMCAYVRARAREWVSEGVDGCVNLTSCFFCCNYICISKSNIIFDDGCNIITAIFTVKAEEFLFMECKKSVEREIG